MKILKIIRGFFLKWSRSSDHAKCDISCQTVVSDLKKSTEKARVKRQTFIFKIAKSTVRLKKKI